MRFVFIIIGLVLVIVGVSTQPKCYLTARKWEEYLRKETQSWFEMWNHLMEPKFDNLIDLAESTWPTARNRSEPFTVAMVGDSTMMHQFGVICSFLSTREGIHFNPEEHLGQYPGCCIDTTPGGGRGLCFRYKWWKFLDRHRYRHLEADVVYFNSGLHLLHMSPNHVPTTEQVQRWLTYEDDLEAVVEIMRQNSAYLAKLIFMTSHTIDERKYEGQFVDIIKGYKAQEANLTNTCREQVYDKAQGVAGSGLYTLDTICEQGLLDRDGSDTLNRRARATLTQLGIPMVEADLLTRDQGKHFSQMGDGRHFYSIVPLEVFTLLSVITAKHTQPPPSYSTPGATQKIEMKIDVGDHSD